MGVPAIPDAERGTFKSPSQTIATIQSKPLVEMIEGMMVYSNNQLAETIGLATATSLKPSPQSLAESASTLWDDLVTRLPETCLLYTSDAADE